MAEHDVIGAKENDLKCIGVLYGYGDIAELSNAKSTYIAKTVEDIIKYV